MQYSIKDGDEEKIGLLLEYIYWGVNILIDKTDGLSMQIDKTNNQIEEYKNNCVVFNKKRDEYINNTPECDSINRMNFKKKYEKSFDLYNIIIKSNIWTLADEYEKTINVAMSIAQYIKEYERIKKYCENNELIKKKQLFELNSSFVYVVRMYLLTTKRLIILGESINYIDKTYGFIDGVYKDPLLYT